MPMPMTADMKRSIREWILAHGFRTAVDYLIGQGWTEINAVKAVRKIHQEIEDEFAAPTQTP